jgi:transcriptional regulator with XRE-family HTH domain
MPAGKALGIWARYAELSLKQIAARLGITKQALTRLLYGKGKPSLTTANAIALMTAGKIPADAWDAPNGVDPVKLLAA